MTFAKTLWILHLASAVAVVTQTPQPQARAASFESDVESILTANCTGCHGTATRIKEMNLNTLDGVMKSSESGPVASRRRSRYFEGGRGYAADVRHRRRGKIWDHHSNLESGMRSCCLRTDKPVAGLLADLKQRGLLKDTLVIWGGEFGRLPIAQLGGGADGRDHNPRGFSIWMAGGGIKPGITYGNTDEFGYKAEENPVSVTDWQATLLHLLGLDYQKLIFDDNGLQEKVTSVYPTKIVEGILV